MLTKNSCLALFFLTLLAGPAAAVGIDFSHRSFDKLKSKAADRDKLIFIDAYASWCGPCKWMAANTFKDEKVGDFFNENFVNTKIDMEKGEGKQLAQRYNVKAYPTLLFVDEEGTVVLRKSGALGAEGLLELGKKALDDDRPGLGLIKRYKKGERSEAFLREYLTTLAPKDMAKPEAFEAYFSKIDKAELKNPDNFALLPKKNWQKGDPTIQYIAENYEEFTEELGEVAVREFLTRVYARDLSQFPEVRIEEGIEDWRQAEEPYKKSAALLLGMNYYTQKKKDFEKFSDLAIQYYETFSSENWRTLNRVSWTFFQKVEDEEKLEKAAEWAKKSVELNENYYNADTYGQLLIKLGQEKKGQKWVDRSKELEAKAKRQKQ